MSETAVRALIIGVSIFVTMIITSVVIFEFTQIKDIYKGVGQTDVSFESRLNEFDKYKDATNIFTGLDVRNTYNKYKYDEKIDVCIESLSQTCNDSLENYFNKELPNSIDYSDEYISRLEEVDKGYKIVFNKK